jgi:hypothetical protein
MEDSILNRLRFRRQFIFGPRAVNLEGEWRTHRFGADWVLTIQRDLPFRSARTAEGAEILLLGFLIDPEAPEQSDQQLFERLCQGRSWEELLRATEGLSGRWALFHLWQGRVRVFNDATGLRSVYYSVPGQEPWCFSQPGLYRRVQPVEYLPEAVEFIRAKASQKDVEACFPAASSPYAEVAHLLTNHYLELPSRTTARFWPTVPLESMELETAVGKAARILQQSMRAITARGRVAFAVTAGRDSRTLLAASRGVTEQLWAHTVIHGELNLASPDLRIASALCGVAGLTHHTLPCPQSMSEPFRSVYLNNHDPAHRVWGRLCQGLLKDFPADTICVRGNVSEAARCVFYPTGIHPATLSGNDLARRCKMPATEFARRHFEQWLAEASPMADLGYRMLDLFFCEHRMPNWLAVSQTEFDIIHDTFSPYSNRRLLALMWATPPAARIKPQCTFYRELIGAMWPELLAFPFNPPGPGIDKLLHKARKTRGQIGAWFGWRPVQVRLEWPGPKARA